MWACVMIFKGVKGFVEFQGTSWVFLAGPVISTNDFFGMNMRVKNPACDVSDV